MQEDNNSPTVPPLPNSRLTNQSAQTLKLVPNFTKSKMEMIPDSEILTNISGKRKKNRPPKYLISLNNFNS